MKDFQQIDVAYGALGGYLLGQGNYLGLVMLAIALTPRSVWGRGAERLARRVMRWRR